MTNDHNTTSCCDIHVVRGPGKGWMVVQDGRSFASANYRLRAHAVAFARAVAFGARADMIVHDLGGRRTRHTRASLSYPTSLD